MSVRDARDFFSGIQLTEKQQIIARQILKEVQSRLGFLADVGLGYLTLARSACTLSGGEAQRIRLATQIGSSLVGVLYILDEPSIGLHQRDNRKLLNTLKKLRDQGNTLIVVEHDEETMLDADYIVDIGPGRGRERRPRRRGGHARGNHGKSQFTYRSIPVRQTPRTHSGNAPDAEGLAHRARRAREQLKEHHRRSSRSA